MDLIKAFTENNMNVNIIIKGTIENPLFRACDIGEALEIKNIHQTINDFDESEKGIILNDTPGGLQQTVFLTEEGLYRTLMKSRKPIAVKFQKWICSVLKEIRLNGKYELEKKVIENEQKVLKIEEKNQELLKKLELANEKNKNTKETSGYVYIATNLKEIDKQTYKVGFAIDEKNRESSMNTSEMDNCFKILEKFYTKDRILSEKIIHTYLIYHKFHYSKEFFTIKLNELINICKYFTKIVDQVTETPMNTLYERLISSDTTHLTTNPIINDNSSINPILNDNSINNINIQVVPKQIKKFKFFTLENYKEFIKDNIVIKNNGHVFTEQLRNAFSKWQNDKKIKPIIYRVGQIYMDKLGFKNEFKDTLEDILEIPQTRIHVSNKKKIRGFTNISLTSDN